MGSEYEALRETVRLEVIEYDGTNSLDVAGVIIALIAERTKEATPKMIEAVMALDKEPPRPDLSERGVLGFGWRTFHAASALYPPRDEKDVEGERG